MIYCRLRTFIPRSRSLRIYEVGSPWVSFFLFTWFSLSPWRDKSFIPRGGISSGIPYGVPFDSLSFLYLTPNTLFLISIYPSFLAIFDPRDFLYWRMDGWVDQLFFFGSYLGNYSILFLNCFSYLKYMFFHFFWHILKKKIGIIFFSKNFAKIEVSFFSQFFFFISQISRKLLKIFFPLFLVPLEEVLRHLLKNFKKKKSNFFVLKKFRTTFFFFAKK